WQNFSESVSIGTEESADDKIRLNLRLVRLGSFSVALLSSLNSQPSTSPILFVADLFHPVDQLAVQRFLNGDMSHRGHRRSAVPMLLARRKPDHIAWPNFLD